MFKLNNSKDYVLIGFFGFLLFFSLLMFQYIFIDVLTAAIIAFFIYPLYKRLLKVFRNQNITSFLMAFLIILVIIIPIVLVSQSVTQEGYVIYLQGKTLLEKGATMDCNNVLCFKLKEIMINPAFRTYFDKTLETISNYLIQSVSDIFFSIPSIALSLFIIGFSLFFFLIEGKRVVAFLLKFLPDYHKDLLKKKLNDMSHALIYGNIFVALIQGVVALGGYFIFGTSSPFVYAFLTFIAAFIPFLGTSLIWLPVSISLILRSITDVTFPLWKGLGLMLYGFLIIGTIDNVIRPKLISGKSEIHPLIIFFGLIGGLSLFGPAGLLVGPIVLSLTYTIARFYVKEGDKIMLNATSVEEDSDHHKEHKESLDKIEKSINQLHKSVTKEKRIIKKQRKRKTNKSKKSNKKKTSKNKD